MSSKGAPLTIIESELYNPKQKRTYIESIVLLESRKRAYSAFKRFRPYEELLGKDLCEFTYQEAVDTCGIVSTQMFGKTKCVREAVHYTDWCMESHITGRTDNPFARLDTNAFSEQAIRTSYFKDGIHMANWMDSVFDTEERPYNWMVRCALWCVWMGLEDEETMSIPIESVEFQSITANGKRYSIPDEAWGDFVALRSTENFSKARRMTREHENLLICRMEGNTRPFWIWISVNVEKARRESGDSMWVTKQTVKSSGRLYREWLREQHSTEKSTYLNSFPDVPYSNRFLYLDLYAVWKKTYYET